MIMQKGRAAKKMVPYVITFTLFLIFCYMYSFLGVLWHPLGYFPKLDPVSVIINIFKESPIRALFFMGLSAAAGFIIPLIISKRSAAYDERGLKLGATPDKGGGHILTEKEKAKEYNLTEFFQPSGLILGVDKKTGEVITLPFDGPKAPENGNVLLVAPSGMRKTSGVLMPNIFSLIEAGYSMVLTDPKGEEYQLTIAAALAHGYNIKNFVIKAGEFQCSDGFDFLKVVRESDRPATEANLLVDVLMSNLGNVKKDFWNKANENLLKCALLTVAKAKGYVSSGRDGARTLTEVIRLIESSDAEREIEALIKSDPYNRELLEGSFNAWAGHREKQSIQSGLSTALDVLKDRDLLRIMSEDEIDFKDLNDKKTIIFIECSDKEATYKCVLSMFAAVMFKQVTDMADANLPMCCLNRPLYIIWEEFKNIGYIPDLSRKIATIRSRHINMIFCLQNISQLIETYSQVKGEEKEYETILANCAVILCGGCGMMDSETARRFSVASGDMTIEEESLAVKDVPTMTPRPFRFRMTGTQRTQSSGRHVYLESEIQSIQKDEIYIQKNGCNPTIEKKYFYVDHPLYQWQTVDENRMEKKYSHRSHIPLWRRRDLERERMKITGTMIAAQEEKILYEKFPGKHKNRTLALYDQQSEKKGFIRFVDFLYEEGSRPDKTQKLSQFIRDSERGGYED